jgi:hypothetical protein
MLFAAAGFYLCPGIRGRRCGNSVGRNHKKLAIGGSGSGHGLVLHSRVRRPKRSHVTELYNCQPEQRDKGSMLRVTLDIPTKSIPSAPIGQRATPQQNRSAGHGTPGRERQFGRAADTCKPIRGSAISILAPSSWRRVSPKTPSHPTASRNCRSGHLAIDRIEGRKQYSHLPKAGLIGDSMPISSEEPAFDTLNARTDLPGG